MEKKEFYGHPLPDDKYLLSARSKKAIQKTHEVSKMVRKNVRNSERASKVLFSLIAPALRMSTTVMLEDSNRLRRDFDSWVAMGDVKDFFIDPLESHFLFGIVDGHHTGLEKFLNEREVFDEQWRRWKKAFRGYILLPLKENLARLGVKVTISAVKGVSYHYFESHYHSYEAVKKFLNKDGYVEVKHPMLRIRFRFVD